MARINEELDDWLRLGIEDAERVVNQQQPGTPPHVYFEAKKRSEVLKEVRCRHRALCNIYGVTL